MRVELLKELDRLRHGRSVHACRQLSGAGSSAPLQVAHAAPEMEAFLLQSKAEHSADHPAFDRDLVNHHGPVVGEERTMTMDLVGVAAGWHLLELANPKDAMVSTAPEINQ